MRSLLSAIARYFRRPHLASGGSRAGQRKARRQRLFLEILEDRTVLTAVAAPSGLVSWWTANNTAADAMGLNNASLTGVSYATGEVGQAFSFDGADDSANVADSSSLAFTQSFTIEGWIKVNGLPTNSNFGSIMFRGDDRGGLDPYVLSVQPNGNLSFLVTPAVTNGSNIQTPIATGQWTHIAATLDDATGLMSLYVNGALAAQSTTDVRPFANLDPTQNPAVGIGNSNDPTSYNVPFNGLIDELAVYNRALTAGEVLGIYKAGGSGKVSSPIAVSNPSVVEGAAGTTQPETFTITRTGSTTGSLSVGWTTADDTARAGTDYVGASGTVTFADGQATATVSVTVNGSNADGPNKDFELIATPSGGTSVLGVGTIQNANAAASISDASATEGSTAIRYFDDFVPMQARLTAIRGLAIGPDGNLYASSLWTAQVLEYDGKTGAYVGVTIPAGANPSGTNPLDHAWALAFGPDGNLYVAGQLSGNVLRYNMTTGVIDEFIPSSAGVYQPRGLTFDAAGDLLVSNGDAGGSDTSPLRDEVLRFQGPNGASPGAALPAPGQTGAVFVPSGSGGLAQACNLAFGPDGSLYVTGYRTNAVNRYDGTTGAFLGAFVSAGSGGLNGPVNLSFRPDGFLYVVNQNDGSVSRYNATTGAFNSTVVPAGTGSADGIAWDANGNLYLRTIAYGSQQGVIRRYGAASQEAFTVSLDYPSANPITVSYATADGSATAGTNYTAASGTVVFAPGETTKTILVQTVDDGVADPTRAFTVSLSSPVNATLGGSQGIGTILDDTKFYVVDGGSSDRTYQYASSGAALGNNALTSGDTAPRGVATTAAGTTEWVVDANKTVYVYSTGGALLGSWTPGGLSSSAQLNGIATNGTDIWLLDNYSHKVYDYAGAASLLSGSQSAASSFSLVSGKNGNTNGKGIVTDGTSFWVVDGTAFKVFKSTLSGSLLGSWKIDPANTHPTGITINPNNVSDVWIVDSGTLKVYQYVSAAGRTSGSQNAAATFALAAGDTNPQGIADPSPAVLDAQVLPFKVTGGGTAPLGLPLALHVPAPHNATGTATFLGHYSAEGMFQLDSFTSATGGTFSSAQPVVFVAANGDRLAFNYAGTFQLFAAGPGQVYGVFVAAFTPVPQDSTGRFTRVTGGSFTIVATTDPFVLGATDPVAYTWEGQGWLQFDKFDKESKPRP
jgi:sugar lactone lactonase YvrE